jgi:hypothetical protein
MTTSGAVLISKLAAVAIAMGVRRPLWLVNVLYIGIVNWNQITITGMVMRTKRVNSRAIPHGEEFARVSDWLPSATQWLFELRPSNLQWRGRHLTTCPV